MLFQYSIFVELALLVDMFQDFFDAFLYVVASHCPSKIIDILRSISFHLPLYYLLQEVILLLFLAKIILENCCFYLEKNCFLKNYMDQVFDIPNKKVTKNHQ